MGIFYCTCTVDQDTMRTVDDTIVTWRCSLPVFLVKNCGQGGLFDVINIIICILITQAPGWTHTPWGCRHLTLGLSSLGVGLATRACPRPKLLPPGARAGRGPSMQTPSAGLPHLGCQGKTREARCATPRSWPPDPRAGCRPGRRGLF